VVPVPIGIPVLVRRVPRAAGGGQVRLEMVDPHPGVPDVLPAEADAPHPALVGQTHAVDVGRPGADDLLPAADDPLLRANAAGERDSAQEPPNFPKDLADSVGVTVPGRKRDRL
jgi:hypothetical protein